MKERINSKEVKETFQRSAEEDLKNLDKIENVKNLEYFNDEDIVGYPWWGEWKEKKEALEGEVEEKGSKYQASKDDKDYEEYSNSSKELEELKRKIDEDVTKYKEEYKKRLKETMTEKIEDLRETVVYNLEEINKEIKEKTNKRDSLIKTINEKKAIVEEYEKYKGTDSEEYKKQKKFLDKYYKDINKLFKEINELEDEKKAFLAVEKELEIESIEKKTGEKSKEEKPEDKKPEDKKPEDKKPEDKKPEDKKPEDKKPEDKKPEDKKPEDKEPEDKKPEDKKLKESIKEEIIEEEASEELIKELENNKPEVTNIRYNNKTNTYLFTFSNGETQEVEALSSKERKEEKKYMKETYIKRKKGEAGLKRSIIKKMDPNITKFLGENEENGFWKYIDSIEGKESNDSNISLIYDFTEKNDSDASLLQKRISRRDAHKAERLGIATVEKRKLFSKKEEPRKLEASTKAQKQPEGLVGDKFKVKSNFREDIKQDVRPLSGAELSLILQGRGKEFLDEKKKEEGTVKEDQSEIDENGILR